MPGALRPSLDLSQKSNVIPSINRRTEATAEDFKELSDIANNHATILDELTQAENRNLFYGIFESKELLEAAFENVEEDGIAIIDPQVGQQIIAKYKNGAWTYQEVTAPIQFYPTKLDRPANGQTGIWYIVLDEKKAYLWVGGWLGIGTDGQNGISAYQVAVAFGFQGTENEWLASLIGKSAYQSAVDNGFQGTEAEWIASLGGIPGKSAYEVAQDEGFQGTVQEWLDSLVGAPGAPGQDGDSAYQIWLDQGNAGTEQEFLDWLKGNPGTPGADGDSAYQIWLDAGNVGTEQDFLNWLKGEPGDPGEVTAQQLADAKQEAIDSANAYTDLQVASSNAWQNRYTDIAALLAGQNNQTIDKFQFVLNASADATVDSGWAVYELKDNATKTANLSDYRKLSEQESMDVASGGGLDPTQQNIFTAIQKIKSELLVGVVDDSFGDTNNLHIRQVDTGGTNPRTYEIVSYGNSLSPGWKSVLTIGAYTGTGLTGFKFENGNINAYGNLILSNNLTVPGTFVLSSLMTAAGYYNSTDAQGFRWSDNTGIYRASAGGHKDLIFKAKTNPNPGWYGDMKFYVESKSFNENQEILSLEILSQDDGIPKINAKGKFRPDRLDLSELIEATSDSDASSKGVAVGYAYVNSSTGAVHKRRS